MLFGCREALLLDETKDSQLQRDLSALSKQFEQLHSKHRSQLLKAARALERAPGGIFDAATAQEEQAKQLKQEQVKREAVEKRVKELETAQREAEHQVGTLRRQKAAGSGPRRSEYNTICVLHLVHFNT